MRAPPRNQLSQAIYLGIAHILLLVQASANRKNNKVREEMKMKVK
jgi:hypothetical protein